MKPHTLFLLPLLACASLALADPPPLLPVPPEVAQIRARELIHKLYEKDFAKPLPADHLALAKLLIAQAKETKDDSAARYVALTNALDIASNAGDAPTALLALDELTRFYAVNALDLKRAALNRSLPNAATPAQCEALTRLALTTADEAATVDAFDTVQQMTTLAESAANKSRQVAVVASIQAHLADLKSLIEEFKSVRTAFALLDKDPHDAAAHLTVGRFYALHKGQWSLGLPHLAASSDDDLRTLALRELDHPTDGLALTDLADRWWNLSEKSTGLTRSTVSAHARDLYKIAQQSITGITLARIESRLNAPTPGDTAKIAPAPGTINLLTLIDPAKDTSQGTWSRLTEGLACDASTYACLSLPYAPPEEFDLRIAFTRTQGEGPIALLLAAQHRSFGFSLDVKGEARFERVDLKIAKDNPTTTAVAISNNHPYTLTVQIRKDHVAALLDNKPLTTWKTDYKDLSRYPVWKLKDTTLCGIGANNAKVTFTAIDLIEITGKGKPTR